MTAGTVMLGLLTAFCGSTSVSANRDIKRKQAEATSAEQAAVKATADRRTYLAGFLPSKVSGWRQRLGDTAGLADREGPEEARVAAATIATEAQAYQKKMGSPSVLQLTSVQDDAAVREKYYAGWVQLIDNVRGATDNEGLGNADAQKRTWLAADDAYADALSALDKIDAIDPKLGEHLPPGFTVALRRATIEQQRKRIAPQLVAVRKRIELEEGQRKINEEKVAAYAARCGGKPMINPWGGEVVGLERALRRTAHDPDSIDIENCTDPVLTTGKCWLVTCNVRGKNAFGALILQRKTFSYSEASGFLDVG